MPAGGSLHRGGVGGAAAGCVSTRAGARQRAHQAVAVAAAFFLAIGPVQAQQGGALPTGGTVTAGNAAISNPSANTLVVTQTSNAAILSWQTFSIGQGNTVHFDNGSGSTLNRVTGNVPSQIDGTLTATGSVYLINPAGIAVGTTGRIATGGTFIASTQDVSDENYLQGGDLTFSGTSTATIVNAGTIGSLGGDVALIARAVDNQGTITAPNGTVGLVAGYEVLVRDGDLDGGKFQVKVGGADTEVKTSGRIRAAAAELRANGGNVYALAGNTKGVIAATGVAKKGGRIFLTAGDGGKVVVSGKVTASRRTAKGTRSGGDIRISGGSVTVSGQVSANGTGGKGGGKGGTVVVQGKAITLTDTSVIDVSGASGGVILVGGDYQGGHDAATKKLSEDVATADTVTVEQGAQILADGTDGNGGQVVVWSDNLTVFQGAISARGGGTGDGGDAEVSGKRVLVYEGTTDLRAENGATGTLLLDPYNLTISDGADSNVSGFTASGDDSVLNVTTLTDALATANVVVSTGTSGSPGSQDGDITVAAPITWSANTVLTLQAAGDININEDITATGTSAGLVLEYGPGHDYVLNGAAITLPGTSATLRIGPTGSVQTYKLIHSMAELDNIDYTGWDGNYALAQDLDASGTTYTSALVGIGTTRPFTGTFAGLGHTITGLTIDAPSSDYVGLFSSTSGATIRDVGLVGGSVTGRRYVGGLVGSLNGTVSNSYATGDVTGSDDYVGGLIGYAYNPASGTTVTQSYATGTVTGGGDAVGGLIGQTYHTTVSQSYATGDVHGSGYYTGGLIGHMNSSTTVSQSYATGNVSGWRGVGGLVGRLDSSTLTQSYATGSVSGSDDVGGLLGLAYNSTVSYTYATGSVSGSGIAAGGLAGSQYSSTVSQSYATGRVSGHTNVGGLIGDNQGTVTTSYWDVDTTGQGWGAGAGERLSGMTGIHTSDAFTSTTYGDFDFTDDWYMVEGETRPFLRSEHSTTITNDHQLQLMAMDPGADYRLDVDIDMSQLSNPSSMWRTSANPDANGGYGFVPVGTSVDPFTGSLDGDGHAISNLSIYRPNTSQVGLIGYGSGARIQDVTLSGGTVVGFSSVGALAGKLDSGSMVDSVHVATAVSGRTEVGGLAGMMNASTVSNSSATAAVSGTTNIGGLVGSLNDGTASQSHATGAVTGGTNVGGLVGRQSSATVTGSYATGAVTGSATNTGGLIGFSNGTSTVSQSYANGEVMGLGSVGGLIGYAETTTLTETHADGDVTGTGNNVGGLVGYQTQGGVAQSYATGKVTGVDNVGGLIGSNDNAQATSLSYATGAVSGSNNVGGLVGSQSGGTLTETYATGTINGATGVGGLVGDLANATVAKSHATGPVTGTGNDVGGLVGHGSTITVSQSYASGAVGGVERVGGLVGGMATSTVTSSYAYGTVTGTTNVGGLIGASSDTSTVSSSFANSKVTGVGNVGGLIGSASQTTQTNTFAYGDVTGTGDNVGGLDGYLWKGDVSESYATGKVTGANNVGGLIGAADQSSVSSAHATGAVQASGGSVGGLVGMSTASTVSQSYATGAVGGRSTWAASWATTPTAPP